jgi:hypothetical protein
MKRLFGCALMLALAVAPALAAKNSQSISLASPVKVGTTNFAAGDCKVTWTGAGDTVQVTLDEHGKSITVPAKLVTEKNGHKGYTVNSQGGSEQLETIQLNNVTLRLVSPMASGQ